MAKTKISPPKRGLPALHPGEILREEVMPGLKEMGVAKVAVARALGIGRQTLEDLLACRTAMTPDMALRWAKYLGTSATVWMNHQVAWDLERAEARLGEELEAITRAPSEAA